LLDGLAHNEAADKFADGLEAAVEEESADDGLHGVGEHGAFAAKAAAVFAAAEAEKIAEPDGRGYFGHVLSADQLGANAGQFALMPLGMKKEECFADDEAKDGVAEEFEAFVVAEGGRLFHAIFDGSLIGEGAVREGPHQQLGSGKAMPNCSFQVSQNRFHVCLKGLKG
jgi:hypothetical protein